MTKILFLAVATVIAAAAEAATAYRVNHQREGWPESSRSSVKVTIDGRDVRADFERAPDTVAKHDYVLSTDGGRTFVAVNDELRTWYRLDASPFVLHAGILSGMTGKAIVRDIRWSISDSDRKQSSNAPIHMGELSYALEERLWDSRIRIQCTAVVKIWPARNTNVHLWPGHAAFTTGIPEIDSRIAGSMELLREFPERIVLVATRQYDGGSPTSETISVTVDELHELESINPRVFVRPAGYREQPPVIGAPGAAPGS